MGGVKVRTLGYLFMRLVVEPTPTHTYPLLRNWMYTTLYELSGEALFHFLITTTEYDRAWLKNMLLRKLCLKLC